MRNYTILFLSPVVLTLACKPPPEEASEALEKTTEDLFADFEADLTDEEMTAYLTAIEDLRDDVATSDFTADARDRAVTLDTLQGDALGDLSIPSGVDAGDQVPIGLPGRSSHDLDSQRLIHTEANQVCIHSDTTKWAGREFITDDACWLDDTCDSLEVKTEIRKENLLTKI
jgi:hypothetical protein